MKIKNGVLVLNKKKTKINEYNYDENIVQLELSRRVKVISRLTFSGCRNLRVIKFNDNLKEIGYEAFYNCVSLEEVIIPVGAELCEGAFMDCRNLKKVVLPPLKVLPRNLFKGCVSLEEIIIPDTVEIIEEGCFYGCKNLNNVVLSKKLKEIGDYAFKRCFALESIIFPETLKKLGHKAFEDDKNLKIVKFNGDLEYLGKSVFYNKFYDEYKINGTAFCSSFTSKNELENCVTINIPETIEFLSLGFEGVLPFAYRNRNKTCPNHVLSIEKEQIKVFMSSAYYSYKDDNDYIIKDGKFDFFKYDNQLEKAEKIEKAFVSAFRLAYPKSLSEQKEKEYFELLKGYEKDVVIFAVEVNDENVLSYLLEEFSFTTEFAATIYSICSKKGYNNLAELVSAKTSKTAINETEDLLNDLLLV